MPGSLLEDKIIDVRGRVIPFLRFTLIATS